MRKTKLFVNHFTSDKVMVGIRLFLAGLILFLGLKSGYAFPSMVLAAIIMNLPRFKYVRGRMSEGAGGDDPEAKLLEKIQLKIQAVVDKANGENVSKKTLEAEVEKINKMIEKLNSESVDALKKRVDAMAEASEKTTKALDAATEALKTQSEAIKKLTDQGIAENAEKPKTFRQAMKDAIMGAKDKILVEKSDDYGKRFSLKDYFQSGNKVSPVITIEKALVDMLQSNIVGANVANIRLTDLDPQRVSIPLTIYPHVMDVFMKKGITRPYMSLMVVYEYENGVATKTEGAASTKSSFKLKTVEFKAQTIATHFIVSDETLDDLEEVLDEISVVAPDKIHDAIDEKILDDAGDDVTDIKGLFHADKSTAYATALGAGSVDNAYIVDLIADAKLQAENAKMRPNAVMLNSTEMVKLGAKKNTMEDSKTDKRVVYGANGEPTFVCGLAVIKNAVMDNDTLCVFDNRQPWIGVRKDITMEIGYNGTDLTEGQKTIVLKCRIAFGVRNKLGVIYVSGIAAAVTALNAGA